MMRTAGWTWKCEPCVWYTDDVVNVAECEFKKFVGENAAGIGESKEGMIGKASSNAHGPRMKNGFLRHRTECLQQKLTS